MHDDDNRRPVLGTVALNCSDLWRLFLDYNEKYFGSSIRYVRVGFRDLGSTLGRYSNLLGIEVDSSLQTDAVEASDTLLHEMVHAYLDQAGDPSTQRRNEIHGAAFEREIRRLQEAGAGLTNELEQVKCGREDPASLARAAAQYFARKSRAEMPSGHWTKCGKWMPNEGEWQHCCEGLSLGTRHWRAPLLRHCCTISHISRLHGVDTVALRKFIKQQQRTSSPAPK